MEKTADICPTHPSVGQVLGETGDLRVLLGQIHLTLSGATPGQFTAQLRNRGFCFRQELLQLVIERLGRNIRLGIHY